MLQKAGKNPSISFPASRGILGITCSSALGKFGGMLVDMGKKRLVGLAVRILGKKRAGGGISPYGAAAMTESKIVTGKAILLLNEDPRPGL